MSRFSYLTNRVSVANKSVAIGAETISKNGRSLKSLTSRGNNFKILLSVCLLAFTLTCFAQVKSSSYSSCMNKSHEELSSEMRTNDMELYRTYSSGSSLSRTGNTLLGIGGGLTVVSILSFASMGNAAENGSVGGVVGGYVLGVFSLVGGIGCLGAGIPIKIVGVSKKNGAIKEYCLQHYSASLLQPHFQVNMSSQGVGLAYKF